MRARIAGFMLCLILLLGTSALLRGAGSDLVPAAEEAPQEPARFVYTTASGKKYHRKDCSSLARSEKLHAYTREAAEEQGYEPCSRCRPQEGTE